MKADRKTIRILAMVLAVIAVSAGWYLALYSPQKSKISALNAQAASIASQRSTLAAQVSQLNSAKRNVSSLKAQLARVSSALPATPQLSQFLTNLQTAASSAGVSEVTVSPTAPAAISQAVPGVPAGVTSLAVTFSVDGQYSALLGFLHNLDGLPRLILVKSVSLGTKSSNSASSGTSSPLLSAQIQASIFEAQ